MGIFLLRGGYGSFGNSEMVEFIKERLEIDKMLNFTEIARMAGCSREYVRQIARSVGITGRERMAEITPVKRRKAAEKKTLAVGYRPATFRGMVRKWLSEIGHGYCGVCCKAKPYEDMGKAIPTSKYRCKRCMADKNLTAYHDESTGYRERHAQWQKDNPEKARAASLRHYYKKKARERNGID